MINKKSIAAVDKSVFGRYFRKPLYESYCFSNIPQTIKSLLISNEPKGLPKDTLANHPEKFDKVVLFLIDGFGWNFFNKYKSKYPFLKRIIKKGNVSKLTTQFPSTTVAQVTTMHSNQAVGSHGLYEWFYYEPKVDSVIAPLPFSFAGDRDAETLLKAGIKISDIIPKNSLYKQLSEKGIPSFAYQSNEYAYSSYSTASLKTANIFAYNSLDEALIELTKDLKKQKRGYFFFYFSKIDTASHNYGLTSKELDSEIDMFFTTLEKVFYQQTDHAGKTLILLTADHGHGSVNPFKTYYINKNIPEILPMLKTNRKGNYIVPAGSCRDFFLHIKDEYINKAKILLEDQLKGKAEIHKTSDLIADGFFGPYSSKKLIQRVGNLVILAYYGEGIWWHEDNKFTQNFKGHHGGLTPQETDIPFLALQI